MKRLLQNGLLILLLVIGLILLLYPSVSNYWNLYHMSAAVLHYREEQEQMDPAECERMFAEAERFNAAAHKRKEYYRLSDSERAQYEKLLDPDKDGIMGILEIPRINVSMPIYHTADEAVLQIAAGHVEWSSLPAGGPGNHTVISGHRGLPSARLFTDLDQLELGDRFELHVLNRNLVYEVDNIATVLPQDLEPLYPVENQDYCTLMTCTPYGINTHRLLVRGRAVSNEEEYEISTVTVSADAVLLDSQLEALVFFALGFIGYLICIFTPRKKE